MFGNWAWDLEPRFFPNGFCSCHPLSHRSTCPPGFRTLTSTAGPRIKNTSCWGCSERKSMWLLPGGLCQPFRWYPCDTLHPRIIGAMPYLGPVLTDTLLAEAGWLRSRVFVFSASLRGPSTPENLFCRVFFILQTSCLETGHGCSVFPASYTHCPFLLTVWCIHSWPLTA